jgi:hypothetical protein
MECIPELHLTHAIQASYTTICCGGFDDQWRFYYDSVLFFGNTQRA